MKIAFLYIAEAYQCYHGASIALELARRPGVDVVSYYNDPQSPHHLERIRQAYGAEPMAYRRLKGSWLTRLLQTALRRFGMFKMLTMWDNHSELDAYDAIFAVEDTVCYARRLGITHPKLILLPHGFGDRARGFTHHTKGFDFVLVAGPKIAKRMLEQTLVSPDGYAMVGAVKLDVCAQLQRAQAPLFKDTGPIVLYNAHKAPKLTSWSRFIAPMLDDFAAQDDFNLIVAPHVKMFRRQQSGLRASWEARGTDRILIDTSSDRLLDMTYTSAADIYVGDVSSQVYEFLATPRPCVFLNAHGIKWQGDPNFAHWQLGDVIDDPKDLMPAIRAAPARHALYRAKQEDLAAASLGERQGATIRAADAILGFMGASY
ncbi:hypothetical protein ACELLULO517_19595 [Acidisoma cellulosilytica]|uniref:Glycosyl transferase n=1 Tax=Acidisoma cellulosilyticum TaxID=2802395 RepID=A0A963Z5X9_9PROT|nr:hypothetical protein [Acidisoma cellulosilyticum]MCB8882462.1 hypothetical protein [Acidisoma cellulosilyticum]